MPDWPSRPFGECGQWLSGGTPRTTVGEYWDGEIPWITSGSLTSFYLTDSDRRLTEDGLANGSRLVPAGTTLFVVRGMSLKSEFRVGVARRSMAFGQDCKAVVPSEDMHPLFLANAVRAASGEVLGMVDYAAHGTGRLNTDRMKSLPIPVPPMETQRKTAAVLAAYDELVEINLRTIETLEGMAQAIYREWFVNFRYPGHELEDVVDSSLGLIPDHWKVARIDSVAELHRGRSYRSKNLVDEGGWPFLNLKCIDRDGGFRRSGLKRYDGPFKEHQKAVAGDIVIALTDMTQERRIVARTARVPELGEPEALMSMDLLRLAPATNTRPLWLYAMTRWSSFPEEVKHYANGANVLHLSPDRIAEYVTLIPPEDLQNRYSCAVDPMFRLRDKLELQNASLRAARDLLLPRLISGEIDVTHLDIDTSWLAA